MPWSWRVYAADATLLHLSFTGSKISAEPV
jgi:hypothetical protein